MSFFRFFFFFFFTHFVDEVVGALFTHRLIEHVEAASRLCSRLHTQLELGQPGCHVFTKLEHCHGVVGVRDGLLGPVRHRLFDFIRRKMVRGRNFHAEALSQPDSDCEHML
jgi:hypothetical protein